MEVKKGFFFSLDTAFAIIIAIILVIGIFFNLDKSQNGGFEKLYLSKFANDALITLDKNRTLETLNNSTIENSLKNILPDNLAFKLNVTVYQCKDVKCSGFDNTDKNIAINSSNIPEENSIIAKRAFLTFENKRIKYFSIAELRIWLI